MPRLLLIQLLKSTAIYLARFSREGGDVNGICLAHSSDGIHWSADENNPVLPGWRDTANQVFYDTSIKKYVFYGRPETHISHVSTCNRLVCRMESDGQLSINADIREEGDVKIEVLNQDGKMVKGFELENAIPLKGNSVCLQPTWKNNSSFPCGNLRFRFVMRHAKLFSISV